MWEEWFAWWPVETNKGWRIFTKVARRLIIDYDAPNGARYIYKEISK